MQVKGLVPLHIVSFDSKRIEKLLTDALKKTSFMAMQEKKISLSRDLYEKLQSLSDLTGIPVKYLIGILLLLNSEHPEVEVTDDVDEYLKQFKRKRDLPFPVDFTIYDVYEMSSIPNDVVWLSSSVVDKLYECSFEDYKSYVLAFSFIYHEKRFLNPPEAYALMAPYSLEFVLPRTVFQPGVPVKDWLKIYEPDDTSFYLLKDEEQFELQEKIGRLLDTHFLDTVDEEIPNWFYETPWRAQRIYRTNPFAYDKPYGVALIEYVEFNKIYGINAEQGRKLSKWFRYLLQNEKRKVWFMRYRNFDLMGFRSGAFLIGKFLHPLKVAEKVKKFVKEWTKEVQFEDLGIPCYSVTGSIVSYAVKNF